MRRTLFWSPNKLFRLVLTGRRTIVPALDCLSFSFHSCPSRHSFDLYRPCYLLAKPCQPFSFLFFLSLLSPLSPLLPPPPLLYPVSRFIPVLFVTPFTSIAPVTPFIPRRLVIISRLGATRQEIHLCMKVFSFWI